jgi:TRAP-type C4-dicarboxylate transport system substrate-binding protein
MTTTPRTTLAALAALAVTTCGATACSDSHTSPSRTTGHGGASAQPASDPSAGAKTVTLRVGTDDGPDFVGAQQIEHFAEEVSTRSGGTVTIEPVWHADGHHPHWDQAVAKMLFNDELDLAMIPSRAWDALGVTSLRALTAPFLVTTDTLTASVVTDDALVQQLTSGLTAVGVSALGLYPEGLRHPFGFHGPLRGASDYQGGLVRGAYSRTSEAMFAALGAGYTDQDSDTGRMIGAESSYRLSPAGVATGNVVFFPKVNTLVIDDDVRSGLSEEQQNVLQDAADATLDWVLDTLPTDNEAAATFCDEAGKISAASQADIHSLVAATRPVVDELRQDATTADLIDSIEELAAGDPGTEPVTACPKAGASDVSLVNGTYAFTMTADQARAAGVTDEFMIDENAGDYVITFKDGDYQLTQDYSTGPKAGTTTHGAGGYTLKGSRLTWFWSHEPGEWTELDVAVEADGSLDFSNVHDGGDAQTQALSEAFYTHWERTDG